MLSYNSVSKDSLIMPLTREQYKQFFLQFDTSGDKKLSFEEFRNYLSKLLHVEVSQQAVKNVFDSVNKSAGDSYITLDEWLDALDKKSLKDVGKDDLRDVFKKIDKNQNNTINITELKALLKSLKCTYSDAEVAQFFDRVDTSDDNAINFDEFANEFFKNV